MKSKFFLLTAAALAIATGAFAKSFDTKCTAAQKQLAMEFKDAKNITWSNVGNLTEASFDWNGQQLHGFYNSDGDQVALSREISVSNLPLKAIQAIQDKYSGYTTKEAIEMNSVEAGLSYYVSMENSGKKVILNVSSDGVVSVFK
jgi:hypothetical protein